MVTTCLICKQPIDIEQAMSCQKFKEEFNKKEQKLKEIEKLINKEFEKQHGWREKAMGGIYWTEGRKNLGKEIKKILEKK